MSKSKRALVLLAEGAEEIETSVAVDVLRRAEFEVVLAGLTGMEPVRCSRRMSIVPDTSLDRAKTTGSFDVIVLPGGAKGAERLASSAEVGALLKAQDASGRWIAAICAAPTALVQHGVGRGRRFTSHPGVKAQIEPHGDYREDPVVIDGNIITSRGPGTSFLFAFAIIEALAGRELVQRVASGMMLPEPSR